MNGNPVPTFVPDNTCVPLSGGGSGNGPLLAFIPPSFPLLNDSEKEFFIGMVLPLSLLAFNAPKFPLLSDSMNGVLVGVAFAPNFSPLLNDSKNEFFLITETARRARHLKMLPFGTCTPKLRFRGFCFGAIFKLELICVYVT